jgi:hypothetical protein
VRECGSAGVRECGSAGVRECGSAGVRECGSAGVRDRAGWRVGREGPRPLRARKTRPPPPKKTGGGWEWRVGVGRFGCSGAGPLRAGTTGPPPPKLPGEVGCEPQASEAGSKSTSPRGFWGRCEPGRVRGRPAGASPIPVESPRSWPYVQSSPLREERTGRGRGRGTAGRGPTGCRSGIEVHLPQGFLGEVRAWASKGAACGRQSDPCRIASILALRAVLPSP